MYDAAPAAPPSTLVPRTELRTLRGGSSQLRKTVHRNPAVNSYKHPTDRQPSPKFHGPLKAASNILGSSLLTRSTAAKVAGLLESPALLSSTK